MHEVEMRSSILQDPGQQQGNVGDVEESGSFVDGLNSSWMFHASTWYLAARYCVATCNIGIVQKNDVQGEYLRGVS